MMTLQNWQDSGAYFNYKGHQIFYHREGKGETLILIHGFPTSSWDWVPLWKALTARYDVIAMDMIGFGFSDKPKSYNYSMIDQADLVEVMMEKMGIERGHILAHDYGDTVVQEMLARYSNRQAQKVLGFDIQSVALLNGGIILGAYKPRPIQKLMASALGPYITFAIGRGSLERNFNAIFGNTKPTIAEIDDFWAGIEYNNGKKVMPLIGRYLHERKKYTKRWNNALAQSPVPLTFINGVEDPISGQSVVDLYKKVVPNGEVVELKGIGHYPQTEAPKEVLAHYLAFRKA